MMERRKCFEGNQKKQRVFTVGLLPANWLVAELKDGDVGVSHTTQTLPQHLCPPSQPPPVSECQAVRRQDGWEGRQVLGGGRSAIDLWSGVCQFLPVAAVGNPARGSLRQFPAANTITAATHSPALSGKHNRGDSRPSHGRDGGRSGGLVEG